MKTYTAMLLGLMWAIAAAAAEEDEEARGGETDPQEVADAVETLIVTGTRMKLPPAQQINNVITFSADDLEIMGVATVEEVFNRLPQNIFGGTQAGGANSTTDYTGGGELELNTFNGTANVTGASTVNLRGIGERGTLILVDGKRIGESGLLGGFSDISSIPMVMVERVDILLDGASVTYGPDAIGGVVNIILRKDFKGTYVRARHDGPVEAGQSRQTVSVATTYGWDRGSLTGTLNFFRTGAMDLSDSNIAKAGTLGVFTPYGTVRGSADQPIMSLTMQGQELGVVPQGESVYRASVPHNANGTPTVADFLETANNPTLNPDTQTGNDLIPAKTSHNLRFDLRQELAAGMGLQAALQYAPRRTTTSRYNSYINFGVRAENPHNPFGELVLLTKYLPEFPDLVTRADSEAWTVDLGLDGDMPWKWFDGWDWQVDGRYSRIDTQTTILNEVRRGQIDAQLRGQTLIDGNGVYRRFGSRLDRTDGLFLNPFGPTLADVNPQVLIDEIVAPPQRNDTSTELTTLNAFVRGEVFELPAGNVQMVLGAERRNKVLEFQYRTTETRLTLTNNGLGIRGFDQAANLDDQRAERTVAAAYAEFLVPVVKDVPFVQELAATLSGRVESADGTGASPGTGGEDGVQKSGNYDYSTWQVGVSWQITDGVRLRGSRHTSYITPSLLQLSIHVPSALPYSLSESFWPSFVDASVSPPVNYVAEGIPLPWILQGSNPELKPERGTTHSVGLRWKPQFVPGLEIDVSYASSELNDRIAVRSELSFAGIFGTTVTPDILARFPNSLRRYDSGPYDGYIRELDGRAINIGYQENANLDYRARYTIETRFGTLSIQGNVNKVIAYNRLDSQNDDAGQLRKFVGVNARVLSACGEQQLEAQVQELVDLGMRMVSSVEPDPENSTFFCARHTATIAAPGTRIPKYSQHVNLGWEHRGLRLNVDFSHREDASLLGGGRTGGEWVTQNYPVNVNLSGAYDLDAGNLFSVPNFLKGTTLRFGLNDLLDHRTKITFNGETDDEYSRGVSFLDYSNRTYYVELATTL